MSLNWSDFPAQLLRSRADAEVRRNSLDPSERALYDEVIRRATELSQVALLDDDAMERIFTQVNADAELELSFRRQWATRIREAFLPYHEHSAEGECGTCGALQGANWMDPDYTTDGPGAEPFSAWEARQR
jgi:hypothetical protein